MSELTAARTLVKSPPELWAQCSDAESLARHLHAFGEITITRLDPERTVAWEGERARGTVRIEPAGWGTKVTLTAVHHEPPCARADGAASAPAAPAVATAATGPEPTVAATGPELAGARRTGLFGWLRSRWSAPEPVRAAAPAPEPVVPAVVPPRVDDALAGPAALDAALDSLGQAHHRPFSRT
jgi:hypothetical protein